MSPRLDVIRPLLESRGRLLDELGPLPGVGSRAAARRAAEAEGGCGVLGLAASVPVAGRHVVSASEQMHNRGNGKGGGLAAAGLDPAQLCVSPEVLRSHYLLQVAYLDPGARAEVERECLENRFDFAAAYPVETLDDWRAVPGLELPPPQVVRYFGRVRPDRLARFAEENGLRDLPPRQVEDEYVYQNSFRLNQRYYASLGQKRAFVLCHGRDLLVFKIVGYAEQAARYYRLEDLTAHVWIAHQRYPTKGRVWHPGGAHPFTGVNEALVHNGDFANYHRVTEYLRQRNIVPLFLTDTEVSALLFDLWDRIYGYPLEVVLEALAPTSEWDFELLPPAKQTLYRAVQQTHLQGSPDGPWFFIIARSRPDAGQWELLGITDTSMLRPQVFALYDSGAGAGGHEDEHPDEHEHQDEHEHPDEGENPGEGENPDEHVHEAGQGGPGAARRRVGRHERGRVQIGLIASERQAIHACLGSIAAQDGRFQPVADRYWVARGGSHTDGGAFSFTVSRAGEADGGETSLVCCNKFGVPVAVTAPGASRPTGQEVAGDVSEACGAGADRGHPAGPPEPLAIPFPQADPGAGAEQAAAGWLAQATPALSAASLGALQSWLGELVERAAPAAGGDRGSGKDGADLDCALAALLLLRDRPVDPGGKKRSACLAAVDRALHALLRRTPALAAPAVPASLARYRRTEHGSAGSLRPPREGEEVLVLDAAGFAPEGERSAAWLLARAYELGWRIFVAFDWRGGRFAGCGLGAACDGLRLELHGDPGDYLGSGLDGGTIVVHGDGQDQLGQILKGGRLIIHGDVGQTFLYGAKGGTVFVRGSTAGRPLINAVGQPRAVINGTCLDYLAESFMAGDPLAGGGFVVVNGIGFDERGRVVELETPYAGGNLFSLASGGAVYVRDPHNRLDAGQLNGGRFTPLTAADWALIEPYLAENERIFGIPVERLLTVDGAPRPPEQVYRKVEVARLAVLH